ncbi:MAG: ATP-binding cassette domain-containing protein, partial [Myxococcota bacterium]
GERQRVALARALALEPKVLVLDEPLMGLDPIAAKGLRRRLVSLQHELQLTSVWITHAPGEAMAVSDRMVVMNEGRIVERGPVPRVLGDPQHGTTQALADARARIVSLLNDPS